MNSGFKLWGTGRKAFSLLELMIVIVMISIVYTLVFAAMQKREKEPNAMKAENIKSILQSQGFSHTDGEFFCLDKCSQCYLYQNDETVKYEGKLALGGLVVYNMGINNKLEKMDFGRFQDHPVCLRFKLYHNGSSSQMVVKNRTGIYYIPALFGNVEKVKSLEEAESLWLKYSEQLKESGSYY